MYLLSLIQTCIFDHKPASMKTGVHVLLCIVWCLLSMPSCHRSSSAIIESQSELASIHEDDNVLFVTYLVRGDEHCKPISAELKFMQFTKANVKRGCIEDHMEEGDLLLIFKDAEDKTIMKCYQANPLVGHAETSDDQGSLQIQPLRLEDREIFWRIPFEEAPKSVYLKVIGQDESTNQVLHMIK